MRLFQSVMVAVILANVSGTLLAEEKAPSATSPDKKRVAKGDGKAIVVTENQKVVLKFLGHTSPVTSLVFAPDGKSIASTDKTGRVNLIEAATGKQLFTFTSILGANTISFSADGKTLEVKSPTVTKEYDSATGKEKK